MHWRWWRRRAAATTIMTESEPPVANPSSPQTEAFAGEPTSQRGEGPTPAGGAYYIANFSFDGRPVPQRFANRIEIHEYARDGRLLMTTLGHTEPKERLPPTP